MPKKADPAAALFEAKEAGDIYSALVSKLHAQVGRSAAVIDPKGTCVHVNAGEGGTAYLGLHPRKGAVLVTIRTQSPIKSKRIRKAEQVSRNRCHCDVLVSGVDEVDAELLGWMEMSAGLVGEKKSRGAGEQVSRSGT